MFPPFYITKPSDEIRPLIIDFINQSVQGILLDSNRGVESPVPVTGTKYDFLAAAGIFDEVEADLKNLQEFIDKHSAQKNWIFSFLNYDLKNKIEHLHSSNEDVIGFPLFNFFVPMHLFISRNGVTQFISRLGDPAVIWDNFIQSRTQSDTKVTSKFNISHVPNREHYLPVVKKIFSHLKRGDIYEVNYCRQITGTIEDFIPAAAYLHLVKLSPGPFACYLKARQRYLLCSSPERFLTKIGSKLISQPIKGTARRGIDPDSDAALRNGLAASEKERAENVMIVDLVRNDFSKFAQKGSVKVEELFGIYTFQRVHQMISTISCEIKPETNFTDIIKATFPMGSMTGAPKISAMKIIDQLEDFSRGLFSGSVGYIDPNGDFDFNVVIRSILFNEKTKAFAIPAGGAITIQSNASDEYDEMILKINPQLLALDIDPDSLLDPVILKKYV